MSIKAVRGFNDILPGRSEAFRYVEEEACRVFSGYGFLEIRPPIVERTELFLRSIGETTDIVEKEMYTFTDRKGESLTLRPEGTAPVVRAYIEHSLYHRYRVARLFYMGPMFRYERPQKGRYRQFHQIGAEVLGDASPRVDAEAIEMLLNYFGRLGLDDVELQINSLGCDRCRPGYRQKLLEFLSGVKDRLCENCKRRMNVNPLRTLDCKNPSCIEATEGAPSTLESLCTDCSSHFDEVKRLLNRYGTPFGVNHRMVRGLDYYTKTTFEVLSGGLGAQNAIAAGGRYDGLVKSLGGPHTPCFGFAIGTERLVLLVEKDIPSPGPLVAFIGIGDEADREGLKLVRELRGRGLRVVVYAEGSLKSRMKHAHRAGADYVVIIGEDELKEGAATLRDMKSGREERVPLASVFDAICRS